MITKNGLIVAYLRPVVIYTKNPPIPPPDSLLPPLPAPRPRVLTHLRVLLPPPLSPKPPAASRVALPSQSPCLAAKAPKVETVAENEDKEDNEEQRRRAKAPA